MNAVRKQLQREANILVASDNVSDASLVMKLLSEEFDRIFLSTDPEQSVADFERYLPNVLVLAFNTMSKAESYCLGLYRLSEKINAQPRRTLILCNKDELNRAYNACKKEFFDDYVLFWPMTNDAPRLLMSVHHALRDLSNVASSGPSSAEFANEARRLSELGNQVGRQISLGSRQIDNVSHAIRSAEQEINVALDDFSATLAQNKVHDLIQGESNSTLALEIERIKRDEIGRSIRAVADTVLPVRQWVDQCALELAPHTESARNLSRMADQIHPLILVVDDDEFQRKIVKDFLGSQNYRVEFASSGVEALNMLNRIRPDLILMDILMSDLDGIETVRRLKAVPQFAKVPVIMMTGKSEGTSVRDSIKAGAANFVVKPFDRETLLAKVVNALKTR